MITRLILNKNASPYHSNSRPEVTSNKANQNKRSLQQSGQKLHTQNHTEHGSPCMHCTQRTMQCNSPNPEITNQHGVQWLS
mmetsp:Transcript_66216/g.110587  ORF Transcript_66216/g.110587 Transcript_66216/m.110587 type:complete len:81 (+) Transcript_66216:43-285(+)